MLLPCFHAMGETPLPWYISPVFLPAAFGLLGVIIGGCITAISSYILDERREQREYARERRVRAIAVRTAARLIELDMRVAFAFAKVSLERKQWLGSPPKPLSEENWQSYRAVLAPELSQSDWLALVLGARQVDSIAHRALGAQQSGKLELDAEVEKYLPGQLDRL